MAGGGNYANQGNVSSKFVESIEVPIPEIEEQKAIVSILKSVLMKENAIRTNCKEVLAQAEVLKKSILSRAFRGELGTNNPDEESAIRKYYQMGYCKKSDENDRKMMSSKKLDDCRDVLLFMEEHNCKMEQESVKAAEIQIHVLGEIDETKNIGVAKQDQRYG